MRIETQGASARQLRALFNLGAIGELTDGQLLERFADGPREVAELAFAALVERHSSMVSRVCSALLADPHDAQDAAQATFLVLVRRARGLWVRDSLGPWLHRVASRVAMASRSATSRRRLKERRAAEGTAMVDGPGEPIDADLRLALHAEIARLPDRYRVPLVLCDLEGRTCEQAARLMGRPVGTVKSWRARGRERLRRRLIGRGFAPPAALAGLLAADAARGATSRVGASSMARLAVRAGEVGAVPASVGLLMQGGLKAMRLGKMRLAALVWGASGLGVGLGAWPRVDAQVPEVPKVAASKVAPRPVPQEVEVSTRPLSLRDALKIGLQNTPGVWVADGESPDAGLRLVIAGRVDADGGRATSALSALVRSATQQYWALVAAGAKIEVGEVAVKLVENALHRERVKLEMGAARTADVAEAAEQLERFKLQFVSDTADIITIERQLRSILGMPPADNRRIVPTSVPFDGPPATDPTKGLAAMMEHRPEIVASRKYAPDLAYEITRQTTPAIQRFQAELDANYKQLATAKLMKAATTWRMEAAKAAMKEGKIGVEDYLDAVNRWATAVARVADSLAAYNAGIVAFEESKGTIFDHAQIRLQWWPTPTETPIVELSPAKASPSPSRTYSFQFSIRNGDRPMEVRGSLTVGPPAR